RTRAKSAARATGSLARPSPRGEARHRPRSVAYLGGAQAAAEVPHERDAVTPGEGRMKRPSERPKCACHGLLMAWSRGKQSDEYFWRCMKTYKSQSNDPHYQREYHRRYRLTESGRRVLRRNELAKAVRRRERQIAQADTRLKGVLL